MGAWDWPACDTAAVAMTGPRPSEPPAIPPARGGAEARALSGRLLAGDPTALADAYARFAGPLADASPAAGPAGGAVAGCAAGPPPAAALAAARAALARLWEHPLRFPAGDDELAGALAALTGRLAAEQPARGPTGPGARGRARRQLRGQRGPQADGPELDPRAELVAMALAARPAAAAAPSYAAPFAAWTAAVDRVLAELTVLDWDRPTGRDGRTPREVVARLAGLDAAVAAAVGIPVAGSLARSLPDTPAEGIVRAGARPVTVAAEPAFAVDPRDGGASDDDGQAGPDGGAVSRRGAGGGRSAYWPAVFWPPVFWPPVLLWRTWHEGARGLCAWLAGREPETAAKPLDALGWTGSIEDHLTGRMLGTWLDGHAIAATAGLRLPSLGPAELGAVTRLALGRARWAPGPDALGRHLPVTLALTHAGPAAAGPADAVAGRWLAGPGLAPVDLPRAATPPAETPPAGTEVSLDVVDFCLLVTGRLSAAEAARSAFPCGADRGAGGALLAGLAAVLPA